MKSIIESHEWQHVAACVPENHLAPLRRLIQEKEREWKHSVPMTEVQTLLDGVRKKLLAAIEKGSK